MSRTFLLASVLALVASTSAVAQTVVSTHPPLSPDEAARVLRSSHSIADLTDYHSPGTGPTIVVMGDSTTPWDWPRPYFSYRERYEPVTPLWPESSLWLSRAYHRERVTPRHLGQSRSVVVESPARGDIATRAPRHMTMAPADSAGRRERR